MRLHVLAVLFVALSASAGMAATYHVAQQAPNASDDSPGTAERPFQTIAKAAQIVEPGDVVIVKPGVYREAVPLRRSGTPQGPITFVADPMGSVVITGADVITGWERVPGQAAIYRVAWPYQFIIDHRADGTPVEHHPAEAPVWGRAEQVIVDSRQLVPAGKLDDLVKAWQDRGQQTAAGPARASIFGASIPDPSDPQTWYGMFAVDTAKKELYLWLRDGSDPSKHQVEAATRGALFGLDPWANPKGVEHVQLRGFIFRYGATFPQRAAVWLHGGHNLIENCVIEEMAGSGVSVHGTLRNCVIRRCGQTGGGAAGDQFLNEECLWEGNCWKPISRGWDAGGFKMAWQDGGVFRRCVFRRNGGPGLWFDIHVRNVLVTECVFQENEFSGLFIEISRDIYVIRNLFVGNRTQPPWKLAGADWSAGGLQIAESENCLVAFNTCVGNKDGITFREQGPRVLKTDDYGEVPYHNTGHVVVGNVCALNKGYQLGLWYDNGFFGWHPAERDKYKTEQAYEDYLKTIPDQVYDPTKQGQIMDRNLYYSAEGQQLFLYGVEWRPKHQRFNDLTEYANYTGFEAHSQVADPLFVNAEAGDYRFRPDSLAWKMQVGWLTAPGNLGDWLAGFVPVYAR